MATETTARQFIFSALILTAILAGAFTLIGLSLPSDTQDFSTYNETYNKFEDMRSNADTVQNSIENAKPSSGVLGIINGLAEVSWGAITGVWDSFAALTTIVNDASDRDGALGVFSLPPWFTGLILGIIVITIAFAIMAAIFKWHI